MRPLIKGSASQQQLCDMESIEGKRLPGSGDDEQSASKKLRTTSEEEEEEEPFPENPLEQELYTTHPFPVPALGTVTLTADRPYVKNYRQQLHFPHLKLALSSVPNSGYGVFAQETIPQHGLITVYGGHVLSASEAGELPESDRRWIKTLEYHQVGIDGRVTPDYTREFYAKHHYLGSFVNENTLQGITLQAIRRGRNSVYALFDPPAKTLGFQIQSPDGGLQVAPKIIVLAATRPIAAGEEIFGYYGDYDRFYLD